MSDGVAPLVGNAAIETAALLFVMAYERAAGREPVDTRHVASAPVDVVSGDRLIEIKAAGGTTRGTDIWLEPAQYDVARTDPRFHLYLVEDVRQGDPAQYRLIDLQGDQLQRLLTGARERRYYTVPWPVAEYDEAVKSLP